MIRVAVVDDHPHVAIALRTLLSQTADIRLVAEARQGSEVFALCSASARRPAVGPAHRAGFDALSAVRDLRASYPTCAMLLSATWSPLRPRSCWKRACAATFSRTTTMCRTSRPSSATWQRDVCI